MLKFKDEFYVLDNAQLKDHYKFIRFKNGAVLLRHVQKSTKKTDDRQKKLTKKILVPPYSKQPVVKITPELKNALVKCWKTKKPIKRTKELKNKLELTANSATTLKLKADFIARHSLVYPLNSKEYKNMKGYGLLYVSALSPERNELPLKQAILEIKKGHMILQVILKEIYSAIIYEEDELLSTKFGKHRFDAIYLIPIFSGYENSRIFIDFAKTKKKYYLGRLTNKFPKNLGPIKPAPQNIILPLEKNIVTTQGR